MAVVPVVVVVVMVEVVELQICDPAQRVKCYYLV